MGTSMGAAGGGAGGSKKVKKILKKVPKRLPAWAAILSVFDGRVVKSRGPWNTPAAASGSQRQPATATGNDVAPRSSDPPIHTRRGPG